MSDTPKTDAAEKHAYQLDDEFTPVCESKFARQLERELAAAQKERDDALMMLGVYKLKSEEQQKRIKRILNAGDAMEKQIDNGLCLHGVTVEWNKAKDEKAS